MKTYSLEGVFTVASSSMEIIHQAPELEYIAAHDRKQLFKLLGSILGKEFKQEAVEKDITHDLVIPVSIPQVHVIHGINLVLPSQSDHFVIGEVIPVKLKIKSVRSWAPIEEARPLKFTYDITTLQDSWALTGKRRAHFTVTTDELSELEAEFSMIPLKTGKLTLPRVDILVDQGSNVKMELDHMHSGETALVVPEFDRLSISW